MIKICIGKKLFDISKTIIKQIDKDYPENIVVVPDRFSLLCEQMIFDELKIKSTFNIKVMGITKLAQEIIQKANLDCVFADSLECKLVLYRAIQKTKDNFLCFSKNISVGLVQKIQNVLSLLRSSDLNSQDLSEFSKTQNNNLQAKLHDLALVNSEYDKMLDGKLDGTNTLKLFGGLIENNLQIKNTNFYFCGFDAFTKQGYEIVKNISKNCHEFVIGAFDCPKTKNAGIYDKELYSNLYNIFKENKLPFETITANSVLNLAHKQLVDNVYGYDLKEDSYYDYAKVIEATNRTEEIELLLKKITELVKLKKCKYSDISVCANSDYFEEIDNIFSNSNISYYIDRSKDFSNTSVFVFLKNMFDLKLTNFDKESLLNLLYSPFVSVNKEEKFKIANYIKENNICFSKVNKLFEQFEDNEFFEMIKIFEKVSAKSNIKEYIQIVKNCLEIFKISEKIDNFCNIFEKNGDFLNNKIYLQIYDKLENIVNKFDFILGKEQVSFEDFVELFFSTLSETKISTVPLSCDSVFVGDASQSYFSCAKYMFVLGANQDVIPLVNKDMGLIVDDEIQKLEKILPISPTVKTINKRNKYKVFDLLTCASENLFVFYSLTDSAGQTLLPSQFVLDILKLNKNQNLILCSKNKTDFIDKNITDIMFDCPNHIFAKQQLNPFNKNSVVIKKALKEIGFDCEFDSLCENKINNGNLMLKNNHTTVSQIESYYSCPFINFAKYGLKLKEQKTAELESSEFGNFIHKFAEVYLTKTKSYLQTMTEEDVNNISNQIFEELINCDNYKNLCDDENKELKYILKNEVKRFANFMTTEQQNSDFKFNKAEYRFGDDNAFCVRVDKSNYSLVGVVDRYDTYENNVRIIDYKTGKSQVANAGLKNLFYGTKIQVYVYLKALTDKFNYSPFGAFYLPVTNDFSKDEEESGYKMHGYFLNNKELVLHCDKTLGFDNPKSKFIEASVKTNKNALKNREIEISSKSIISSEKLQNMLNYSIKMVENAIKDIIFGNITPSPYEGTCKYCKFNNICAKEIKNITERKVDYDFDKFEFDFGGQDE